MGLLDQVLQSVMGGGRDGDGRQSALMPALMSLLGGGASNGGGGLGGMMGNGSSAARGGLGGLVDRFGRSGHGDIMQSWISTGTNRPIAPDQLHHSLGDDTVSQLQQQTGMERGDLLSQLSRLLPTAVDKLTPNGRLPDDLSR